MPGQLLTQAEQAAVLRSLDDSTKILTGVYQNVVNFRGSGQARYARKAHKDLNTLVKKVKGELPLYIYNSDEIPSNSEEDQDGGAKRKIRNTTRRRRG